MGTALWAFEQVQRSAPARLDGGKPPYSNDQDPDEVSVRRSRPSLKRRPSLRTRTALWAFEQIAGCREPQQPTAPACLDGGKPPYANDQDPDEVSTAAPSPASSAATYPGSPPE